MTIWFGAASIAIATWLTASTAGPKQPAASDISPRSAPIDRASDTLRLEVERLHERLAPNAEPSGQRDLFRFSTPRRSPDATVAPPAADSESAPSPAATPPMRLIGIAEDVTPDGLVRTAVVSGPGDVFLVKPGDTIADRYRVVAVSPDSIQLVDPATSIESTLTLR